MSLLRYGRVVSPPAPAQSARTPRAESPGEVVQSGEDSEGGGPNASSQFKVHLDNFEGPLDLLLGLIAKHKLDVTEVALSQVTVEFIDYIRAVGAGWDLGVATEFLVVASTLLDLKATRLLPIGDIDDEEDLALLETRDLLFARLLQYRAYKQVAAHLAALERAQSRRFPRPATLEPRFADALPELLRGIGADRLAELAARALMPKPPEPPAEIAGDHLHVPRVSVSEHMAALRSRLSRAGAASFRSLAADCTSMLEVVARFLALLELHHEGSVTFEQIVALGELRVRWVAPSDTGDSQRAAHGSVGAPS